jgi:ankyrin repeat protein
MAMLIKHGARLNVQDDQGNSLFYYAIQSQNIDAIQLLLQHHEISISTHNRKGITPLMLIAFNGEKDNSIPHGGITDDSDNTPYEQYLPALAGELLLRGCKINDADNSGHTALLNAALIGRMALARFFINHGAKVNVCDHDGNTPLHLAAVRDNADMITLLLKSGNRMNVRNKAGLSALDIANRENATRAAAILMKHHARAWKYARANS